VDGFLLVDKPGGWTSHDVVAKTRAMTGMRKVGHAGTLDPMATGLLVLGLGRATRLLRFVQEAPKEYLATALLGVATDTLDAEGSVLTREPMPVTEADVRRTMGLWTGDVMQRPPMVAARRVGGRRLYDLARQGVEVEREARPVTIYELELVDFAPSDYPEATFRVRCSRGTYVRALADDIAAGLGGRAHLTALRRTRNGSLSVEEALTIDRLGALTASDAWRSAVLPPSDGLPDLPALEVSPELVTGIRHGLSVPVGALGDAPEEGAVRLVAPEGGLLAVYAVRGGRATPEVVLA